MTLLLTGTGGFIGSALLRQLQGQSNEQLKEQSAQLEPLQLRVLYRTLPASRGQEELESLEVYSGDLCDETLCNTLCEGVQTIVHLAGQAHVQSSKGSHIRNTYEISSKLIKAAIAKGVKKFIYISSTKANFPQHSSYAEVKLATETMLLNFHTRGDIKVVCLRPSLVYGPGMRGNLATLLKLLKRPVLPIFPASSSSLGMISLEDCCRAISASLENEALCGHSWELNDGQLYSLDSITRQVRSYLGFANPWLQLPEFSVKLAAKLAELSSSIAGTSLGMGTYRALYKEPYRADKRFAELSGFKAQQSFFTALPVLMESIP